LARRAQRTIERADAQLSLAAFDVAIGSYPASPLPYNDRGEVHLWLGNAARADADFLHALQVNPRVFWAFVGRAAACLLQGDASGALVRCEEAVRVTGCVGPTLFAYRGEALRLLGRMDDAIQDLEFACAEYPARVGAWLNLALARGARTEQDAVRNIAARLFFSAPVLLSDAARELSVSPRADATAPIDVLLGLFGHALGMMRGNRSSSCTTYFTREGAVRFVSREGLEDEAELGAVAAAGKRLHRDLSRSLPSPRLPR
jgi:tetratricopeptide (TPR) repeat protein